MAKYDLSEVREVESKNNIKSNKCVVCQDIDSCKYYIWREQGEYYNKIFCNKHYTQMRRHGYLLDNIQSEHLEKKLWTQEEKDLLEQYYKDGLSFEEISKLLNRSVGSLSTVSCKLKLGFKYMRPNNIHFKAEYQNYDWCYDKYITQNMSFEEISEKYNISLRVVQKWFSEKHKLNTLTYKENMRLTDIQKQLVMFGILGDGHIDRRETQPMYIESHAINQKDYLFWKYDILKNICNKEPSHIPAKKDIIRGKECNTKESYRICTRIINDLKEIRDMSRMSIISSLNEFGLCIHTLDDGCRNSSNWEMCLAEYSQDEIDLYLKIIKNKFDLNAHRKKDIRYITYDANSSRKLDKIILDNIPNDLDIIKYKITENKMICKPANYIYIIDTNGKNIGLNTYCRSHKISYLKAKQILDSKKLNLIKEDRFIEMVG